MQRSRDGSAMIAGKQANVSSESGPYGNALLAVSCNGCEGVVRLLLERGININAKGGTYRNALVEAFFRGHSEGGA